MSSHSLVRRVRRAVLVAGLALAALALPVSASAEPPSLPGTVCVGPGVAAGDHSGPAWTCSTTQGTTIERLVTASILNVLCEQAGGTSSILVDKGPTPLPFRVICHPGP